MTGFDVSTLSPEELQQLTIHAIKSNEECVEAISELQKVIQMIVEKITWLDEHVDSLEKVVMDEIIGGVKELYEHNQRSINLEGLKSKYSSMFDPHMDFLKEMYPNVDIYEDLLKEKEGFEGDDEAFDGRVNEISSSLKAKIDKIRGIASPEKIEKMEKMESEVPSELPTDEDITMVVKRMKGSKSPLALS